MPLTVPTPCARTAINCVSRSLGGQVIRRWLATPRRVRVLGIALSGALVYTALDLAGLSS